jgi:hypothetical protein
MRILHEIVLQYAAAFLNIFRPLLVASIYSGQAQIVQTLAGGLVWQRERGPPRLVCYRDLQRCLDSPLIVGFTLEGSHGPIRCQRRLMKFPLHTDMIPSLSWT